MAEKKRPKPNQAKHALVRKLTKAVATRSWLVKRARAGKAASRRAK
jgi:hypothetical protein